MTELTQRYDTLPYIETSGQRSALSPILDERIWYAVTKRIERWSGSAWLADSQTHAAVTATYSASITIDADQGTHYKIGVTDGSAFTINAPTNPTTGFVIAFDIANASGGAMGTITWDSVFKMAAFTNPADGYRRTISFYYNGTTWIELQRAEADI